MKLAEFKCNNEECQYTEEKLFQDTEELPTMLEHFCPMCGGILYEFGFKNNPQRWKFND